MILTGIFVTGVMGMAREVVGIGKQGVGGCCYSFWNGIRDAAAMSLLLFCPQVSIVCFESFGSAGS